MNEGAGHWDIELEQKLKILILIRMVFASFLLGSTLLLHFNDEIEIHPSILIVLYGLVIFIFALSIIYLLLLKRMKRSDFLSLFQISVDCISVTVIIYLTGGFWSIFSFLYLIVIIYSSMLLYRVVGMIIAAFCSIQYSFLVDLQYYGFVIPFGLDMEPHLSQLDGLYVLYKVGITISACLAIGYLSGLLADQTRKTNTKLIRMKERLKRVEKIASMGEMAAGLAHEVKNPLASLSGAIQLLKQDIPYNPDHERLMQIVLRETDRLSALVNNFLMFAKPPDGKSVIIELKEALEETVSLFEKDKMRFKDIHIRMNLIPKLYISMDPVHFRQILWNLLINAGEAIEEKGEIFIDMTQKKDNRVVVRMRDSGCGMTKEVISQIFNPFFTTKPKGTGLGLSIVHRILETYNADLYVESKPSAGATVTMSFIQTFPDFSLPKSR